jgi:hypothetical protein
MAPSCALIASRMAEVFNLFNHANSGTYVTAESNAANGKPAQNLALVYQPRMAQFGLESFSKTRCYLPVNRLLGSSKARSEHG